MAAPTLSAIIITRNEERNLGDCLASLAGLVQQIVVVDSNSTDRTVEIAQQYGAIVAQPPDWPGFGPQKNRALDLAACDWVLSIDADERLTPALVDEIHAVLNDPARANAYEISRSSWYCGRFIRHSGWSPDYVLRLFRRGSARFTDDLVHERVVSQGRVARLSEPMLHYTYRDFSDVLSAVDRYSTASAQQAFARGRRATVATALGHGLWAFLRTYVFRRGFLDGQYGLALAISNAEASYYRYIKIWHIGRAQASEQQPVK